MRLTTHVRAKIGQAGSTRRRYLSLTSWSVTAAVASRALSLIGVVASARILGQTVFGQFGVMLNTANIVGTLAAVGLGITATKYVAEFREREPERAGRILGLAWLTAFASGSAMTVLSIVSAHWMADKILHAVNLTGPLRILSALILLNAMLAFQNGALAGLEVFRKLALINIFSGIVTTPLVLFAVWRYGLYGISIGTVVGQLITWAFSERLLLDECRQAQITLSVRGALQELQIFWTFSVPALLTALSTMPAMWVCTVLIVRSKGGFNQMALYTAADRWRVAILFIPSAIFQAALPLLVNTYKCNPQGYSKVAKANLWLNLGFVTLPVLLISGLSRQIMGMYGQSFRSGWPILVIFAASTIPEALNSIFGYPLIAQGRMWARFWYDILLSGTLLVLGAWLIPAHGTLGFAIAYTVAFSVTSTALYADLNRVKLKLAASPVAIAQT